MRQHLNNPWVVLGLCVVAVVIFFLNMEEEVVRQALPSRVLPLGTTQVLGIKPLNHEDSIVDKAELGWTTAIERDPFAPMKVGDKNSGKGDGQESRQYVELPVSQTALPVLELSAVALEPEPRVAMINRKLVEEGDRVEGLRVAKIEADGVWLHGPSGRHRVGFKVSKDRPRRRESSSERERIGLPPRVAESKTEEPRVRKDTVLKDVRDCSVRSTCS